MDNPYCSCELTEGPWPCEGYNQMAAGLAPEIWRFEQKAGAATDFIVSQRDSHNLLRPGDPAALQPRCLMGNPYCSCGLMTRVANDTCLRPETVESLFILFRLTGETKYQVLRLRRCFSEKAVL